MKIARSADIARLAVSGNFGGITVQTLGEADYFFDNGFTDITYSVGIAPGKLDRAAAMRAKGADLKVITDNVGVAMAIAEHGGTFAALIEIECGAKRAGLMPEAPEVIDIGRILHEAPRVEFRGVLTNAGHGNLCRSKDAFEAVAEAERTAVVRAAERLADAGIPCPVVSVGSTATAVMARNLSGVTEMRPGLFAFNDLIRAGIGLCGDDDIALSLLATVIGHYPDDNRMLLDAGITSLSLDHGTANIEGGDKGFGLVMDLALRPIVPGLKISNLHTEHAWVEADGPLPYDNMPVGSMVRILPNHANNTATMHDRYHVIDGGDEVVAVWPRCHGW
jgi:D-serine deaminase-like pyridoxal phosphate-dependent protein